MTRGALWRGADSRGAAAVVHLDEPRSWRGGPRLRSGTGLPVGLESPEVSTGVPMSLQPNRRLKLTAREDYGMSSFSARRSLGAIR